MKKILSIIILALFSLSVYAAPLTTQQKQQVITRLNAATGKLKSMTCDFTQTKHLSMLNDRMVSKGKMYFSQPTKLRWEYTSPYKYLFILNGNKVYVGNKSRNDVIDTNTNKIFKEIARIMMNTVTGKALSNSADFRYDVSAKESSWQVTLIPKRKGVSAKLPWQYYPNMTDNRYMKNGISTTPRS